MGWKSRIIGHGKVSPDQLTANPLNHRKHPQRQREALAASIREVGFIRSVTVNKRTGNLIDGHERVWQALENGEPEIDVEYVDLDENEERIALATMDRIAEYAETDPEQLESLLNELQTGEEALQQMLAEMAADAGLDYMLPEIPEAPDAQINRAEELQKEWGTKAGQIWEIGERKHRLMCGDSTSEADVVNLLNGAKPFIMVTDPSYGVEYDPEWRHRAGINDSSRRGKVENDDQADWTEAYKLFLGHVAYIWHAGRFCGVLANNLYQSGFEVRTQLIWRKQQFAFGRGHYHWQHEPCWYAVRKGGSAKWCGDRTQSTIWDIVNPLHSGEEETTHGTQKPVECLARPIRNHGDKSDDVYDPFLGSGTTMVAAEQLERRCFGLEIHPPYVAVILQRMKDMGCEGRLLK